MYFHEIDCCFKRLHLLPIAMDNNLCLLLSKKKKLYRLYILRGSSFTCSCLLSVILFTLLFLSSNSFIPFKSLFTLMIEFKMLFSFSLLLLSGEHKRNNHISNCMALFYLHNHTGFLFFFVMLSFSCLTNTLTNTSTH